VAVEKATELGLIGGRSPKNSFEASDEVWAIFDRDEHPRFDEALRLCAREGISVGLSNPCFEVWLLLHFIDFDRPEHRDQVQRLLRTHCPEYDPHRRKTVNCDNLMQHLRAAEDRAERITARRTEEGMPLGSPSTTVFELTRRITLIASQSLPRSGARS
jgi:hypothetical protein